MNENNLYQKDILQKLKDDTNEINSLREKISLLENKNNSYQNKILDLKLQIKDLLDSNIRNKNLGEEKKSFLHRIEDLENDIINLTSNIKQENRLVETKLESEVIFYKGLHETGMAKVDAAENIIKLNNAQNKYIIDLEKELENLKSNNDINICKLKIEHDLHFYNLKKKMMDYVKEIQHNMNQNNMDNLELNSRLGKLYKNQMLNELEHQALQIKELLKIKEKYEKIIFILNQELDLHKKVEKSVLCKNMKYLSIIKDIDKNYLNNNNSLSLPNEIPKKGKISLSEKKHKKNKKFNFDIKNEDLDRIQLNIVNNIINSNHYHECNLSKNSYSNNINKKYYDDYISLKKLYDELYKENQNLKEQIITIKDKQKMFYNKFSGLLKLYKNAIDELLTDEELKNKNIQINKKIIEQGNYDSFSNEQKYIILINLVKKLLPLLDKNYDDSDIDSIRNSFQQSFNFNTNTSISTGKGVGSSRNITLSKLSKLNFRSVLDNKISIYENKSRNYFEKPKKLRTIYKNTNNINLLKTLGDEKNDKIKLNEFDKDKFSNRNKSLKLFKCIKVKNMDKPLRFIYIKNNLNIDYDFNHPTDTCLTKNNFFS